MALKRAGIFADGWNRSPAPVEFCLEKGIIASQCRNFCDYDMVFVALPPENALDFINNTKFKRGAVVSDICGVKSYIADNVCNADIRYVGCHPMAGKEVSTVYNACADLFDGANMIITPTENTDPAALEIVKELTRKMGFKRIIECSPKIHDKKIAYTSQLAHVVANAYVKGSELTGSSGFTGGSFQDMTRIAGVDEKVWASLYLKNAEELSACLGEIISDLSAARQAVLSGDRAGLEKLLAYGRERFESDAFSQKSEGVKITEL